MGAHTHRRFRGFPASASALTHDPLPPPPPPTAGCLVLISQKATLTSKLQTTRASLLQSENRVSVANKAHRDLERLVEDLTVSSNAAKTAESTAQSKVRELQAALVAETERAEERAKELESARAAARADQAALDACRDDLDRHRERDRRRQLDSRSERSSSGFGARASRDDGADDWHDIITDIIHPSHLYDRKPRDGTSHRLAGDAKEMAGLEEETAGLEAEDAGSTDGDGDASRGVGEDEDDPPQRPHEISVLRPEM